VEVAPIFQSLNDAPQQMPVSRLLKTKQPLSD
jgi:hypothetical protein